MKIKKKLDFSIYKGKMHSFILTDMDYTLYRSQKMITTKLLKMEVKSKKRFLLQNNLHFIFRDI